MMFRVHAMDSRFSSMIKHEGKILQATCFCNLPAVSFSGSEGYVLHCIHLLDISSYNQGSGVMHRIFMSLSDRPIYGML